MHFPPAQNFHNFILIACSYLLALLPPFLIEWQYDYNGVYYLYSNRNHYAMDTSLIIVLIALILTCFTQYTGRWQRAIFVLQMTVLSWLGMFATGHVMLYDAPISVGAIDALLGTDLHEALEYLSFQWSFKLAFDVLGYSLLILACFVWVKPRINVTGHLFSWISSQIIALPFMVVLALACYQYPSVAEHNKTELKRWKKTDQMIVLNNQVPTLRIIYNVREWLDYSQWLKESQALRASYRFQSTVSGKPRTVIVVLGESLRRGNLSLYGYDKKTTPHLDARRQQLLVFNQAIASANQTVPSITKMMTPATVIDPDRFLFQPSIITAAKEAGYRTYWLSNQGRVGQFDSKISLLAHEADVRVFTNTEFYGSILDDKLLHPLSVALQDAAPYKLIVVHLQGSHQSYKNRYPLNAAVFSAGQYPYKKSLKKQNKVMAQYDNSVYFTDDLLENILQQLEKIPDSVLLFVSDHGERFYENGVATAGHGYAKPTKHEYQVPYFIWCNGACSAEWQEAAAKHRNLVFSTENMFHTIANLSALTFRDYQSQLDILSLNYKALPVQVVSTERKLLNYKDLP